MSVSKTYTGCIYSKPPDKMKTRMDLTRAELLEMVRSRSLEGLPILIEHETTLPVGRILKLWEDGRNNFFVNFVIDTSTPGGTRCVQLISDGTLRGLSLSHEYYTRVPLEVSLCYKGMREGTWVVNASASGQRYKSSSEYPIVGMDPTSVQRLLALVNASDATPVAEAPAPVAPPAPVSVPQPVSAPAPPTESHSQKRTSEEAGLDNAAPIAAKKYATPLHEMIDLKGQVTPENARAVVDFATKLAEEKNALQRQLQESREAHINELAASISESMERQGVTRDKYWPEIQRMSLNAATSPQGVELMRATARTIKTATDNASQIARRGDLWDSLQNETQNKLMSALSYQPTAIAPPVSTPAPAYVNASSLGQHSNNSSLPTTGQPKDLKQFCVDAMVQHLERFQSECPVGVVYKRPGYRGEAVENYDLFGNSRR